MHTIVSHSAKGGTGKTTITLNIARELVEQGKKVAVVDFDLSGPSFSYLFPLKHENDPYLNDYLLDSTINITKLLKDYKIENSNKNPNLSLIYSNPNPSQSKVYKQLLQIFAMQPKDLVPRFKQVLFELNKLEYDYVLIDNSTGVNQISLLPLLFMNTSLILLRPNVYGQGGTKSVLNEAYLKLKDITENHQQLFLIMNFIPDKASEKQDKMIQRWKKEFEEDFQIPVSDTFNCYCREWEVSKEEVSIWFPKESDAHKRVKELVKNIDQQ
ncbi:MAG: tyrosine-protein kinase family protein [Candidatus Hodarchaeales archaeon]|jgi:cellulose biosynthesis protein BcsQ